MTLPESILFTEYLPEGKERAEFEKLVDDTVLIEKSKDITFSEGCDVLNEKAWNLKTTFYAVVYEAYQKQVANENAKKWADARK